MRNGFAIRLVTAKSNKQNWGDNEGVSDARSTPTPCLLPSAYTVNDSQIAKKVGPYCMMSTKYWHSKMESRWVVKTLNIFNAQIYDRPMCSN